MTDAGLSAAILLLALILFVSERVRHDLVALIALFACVVTGLVAPRAAFLGFADPAVIAVASVLVVGRAVELTGFAAALARRLIPREIGFPLQLAMLMAVAAALSAFMNNIAALVITMPLATQIARRAHRPPGAVLMPLAFATILGGMTTLIGTPANLILSSVREQQTGSPFGFFAMTGVGTAVAAVGLLYLSIVGWRLLPARQHAGKEERPWRVYELDWPLTESIQEPLLPALRAARARLLARFRGSTRQSGSDPAPGDRLLVLSRESQWLVAERTGLAPVASFSAEAGEVTARVVVGHGSFLIDRFYEDVRLESGGRVEVVAAGPRAARLLQPLDTIEIRAGDQLFIRGSAAAIADFIPRARLLEIDRFDPAPLQPGKAMVMMTIFAAAIAAAVTGLMPPALAFLAAAATVAALRLIPAEDVYRAIDWPVIVLIAAMIPVGAAFEASGGAEIVANALAGALSGAAPFLILATICATTLLLSIFLNNVATAVIMGPIAIDVSNLLGLDPDAALLAVLIGASSDFLTPIGHQNNLLVMGPGGYRFTDYARMGAPLAALTVATAAAILSMS